MQPVHQTRTPAATFTMSRCRSARRNTVIKATDTCRRCIGDGEEVTLVSMDYASEDEDHDHASEHSGGAASADGISCHFHAGVE